MIPFNTKKPDPKPVQSQPPSFVSRLKAADPTFMPDKTPEQIEHTLKDPLAAGAFYDTLAQRYPDAIDMDRDAFIERTSGKKPKKVKVNSGHVTMLAKKLKERMPDFKGNVSSDQLATAWIDSGDPEKIYRDLSEVEGMVDMSYAAFEQLMSADDEHAPYREAPDVARPDGGLTRWSVKQPNVGKRDLSNPEQFTGDESPLGWGIRKMGNYEDRLKIYDNNELLQQRGRIRVGGEAIKLFEDSAGDAIAASRKNYDKEIGKDGAFDELISDYVNMVMISSMNPDKESGQREMAAFIKLNEGRMSHPDLQNALNAMRGLSNAARDRQQLFKQNPEEAATMMARELQAASGTKNTLESAGDWAFRAGARQLKNVGSLLRNDVLVGVADDVLERHKPLEAPRAAYEYYINDERGNRIVTNPETREFLYAINTDGEVDKSYEIDPATEAKLRTEPLETHFNPSSILTQTADVIGDLILDAAITGGVAGSFAKLGAKRATALGVMSSGYLRTQDAARQAAMDSGRSSGEAYIDQVVKGLMVGASSLINPIEGQLAAHAFKTASGKALSNAVGRYSMGKVTWTDMLKEFGAGAARSAVGESVEEVVQDHVLDRGYNALVYGHDYELNSDAIAETIMVSALVGALGGSVSNLNAFSDTGLMKQSIRTVLDNPDLVDSYLEGVRKVDPEMADLKAAKIAQLTTQIKQLKPPPEKMEAVAEALVQRNILVDQMQELGKDMPIATKKRFDLILETLDAKIDDFLRDKKEEPAEPAPEEGESKPSAEKAAPKATDAPKTEPRKRKAPPEAWKLKHSTNSKDVAGYEAWRESVLDKKGSELTPEEQATFENLDPDKTVREQYGDNAGVPTPKSTPIPKTAEELEQALLRPGFLSQTEVSQSEDADGRPVRKERKGLWLTKKRRDENSERVTDMTFSPEEQSSKMEELKQALADTKKERGTLEDFYKKLDALNIEFGLGKDLDTGNEISRKAYRDAVFQSYLDYEKPKPPKLQKVTITSKGAPLTYTYNNISEQWEDENGVSAKGIRKGQITRALAKTEKNVTPTVRSLAKKIASGAKDFTPEEQQLQANEGKAIEAELQKQKDAESTASLKELEATEAAAIAAGNSSEAKKAGAKLAPKREAIKTAEAKYKAAVEAGNTALAREAIAEMKAAGKTIAPRLDGKPKVSDAAIPAEVKNRIDAYVANAVASDGSVLLEEIFPEGIPEGVTEATVQSRYLLALRKNKDKLLEKMGEQIGEQFPAPEATTEQRVALRKIRGRTMAPAVAPSRFALAKLAKSLTGEAKKAAEILHNLHKSFRNSGITIYFHETIEDFANGIAQLNPYTGTIESLALNASGVYGNGQIHVFAGKKDFDAVAAIHEAIHPILVEALATHPELHRELLNELVSDPDLFERYWVDFAWAGYTGGIAPETPEEAAVLLREIDEEALTEMLASKTMQKLMENLPRQKKSVREKLQSFLAHLLDMLGFTKAAASVYQYFEPASAMNDFFADINTVDDFATQFAKIIANAETVPLSKAFLPTARIYASKQEEVYENRMDDLYDQLDYWFKTSGETLTLRDTLVVLSNQIASGYFSQENVIKAYEETVNGAYYGRREKEWAQYLSPQARRVSARATLDYNKEALKNLETVLKTAGYSPGVLTAADINEKAVNEAEFANIQAAYNRARLILEGVEHSLPTHVERAMAYSMYQGTERLTAIESEMDLLERQHSGDFDVLLDTTGAIGQLYANLQEEHLALTVTTTDIWKALQTSGTAHARALAFRTNRASSSVSDFYRKELARLSGKLSKTDKKRIEGNINSLAATERAFAARFEQAGALRQQAMIGYAEKIWTKLLKQGDVPPWSFKMIIDKYKNPTKPSASLKDPIFLTTNTTVDMRLFLHDLKMVVLAYGKNNPSMSMEDVAAIAVREYTAAGIEISEMDVYAALTLDSSENVEHSLTEYQAFKQETMRSAKAAQALVALVHDYGVQITARITQYKKERRVDKEAVRASSFYPSSKARNDEYVLIKEILDRLKIQASAFEIAPLEFKWLVDNINALETQFHSIFKLDYPVDEDTMDVMLRNARNIADFEKLGRLEKAHAAVDAKIAALKGATTPKDRYLAVMDLIAPKTVKYMGQTVLDSKYESSAVARERRALEDKRRELRRVFDDFKKQEKPIRNAVFKTFSTVRVMKTMLDASAVLNQGGMALRILAGNKKGREVLKNAFSDSYLAAFDEFKGDSTKTQAAYESLLNDPNYAAARMAGLSLTVPKEGMDLAEEYFMDSWLEDIEKIGKKATAYGPAGAALSEVARFPLRIKDSSEAMYVTYLNSLRMAMFNDYYNKAKERTDGVVTVEELKMIAEAVNVWTGRASTIFGEKISPIVSAFLWAPRYYAAQIKGMWYLVSTMMRSGKIALQMRGLRRAAGPKLVNTKEEELYGKTVLASRYNAEFKAQQFILGQTIKQLTVFTITQGTIYMMFKGLCPSQSGVGSDYSKSTFMKQICGDEVYDVSGGIAYWARFGAQMAERSIHAFDPEFGVTEGYYGRQNMKDVFMRAVDAKLNPVVSTFFALGTNEDFMGRPYGDNFLSATWAVTKEAITPISVKSIYDLATSTDSVAEIPKRLVELAFIFHGMNYYKADNAMNNLAVESLLHDVNERRNTVGKGNLSLSPKPPKEFTKKNNPVMYAKYKEEFNKQLGDYLVEEVAKGTKLSEQEITKASSRINKELAKRYKSQLERGEY